MTEVTIKLPTPRQAALARGGEVPDAVKRLSDHAHYLIGQGKHVAAEVALRRALAISSDHPLLLSNAGSILYETGKYKEAEGFLRRSIEIESEYAPAHSALGSVLAAQGRYQEAKPCYHRALKIEPDYYDAEWNYSMVCLDYGDWKEAWPHYEVRKKQTNKELYYPKHPYAEWKGEDLNGKTIYVQGEQGLGDRILFSRYLPWMKKQWPDCKIKFLATAVDLPDITNLMWAYEGIVDFVPNGVPKHEGVDYYTHLMSLPLYHGSTPDHLPDDPKLIWQQALKNKMEVDIRSADPSMMKVGVCWTGNPKMRRNNERSIPFELILQLAEIPNVTLWGFQFGTTDIEDYKAGELIRDLTPQIRNFGFAGTAACIMEMDLMITCCTATAHLAGALGAPCWVVLCANPYFVWLRGRENSIWYPQTTLFRQKTQFDWKPVMADVKDSLREVARMHVENYESKAA